MYPTYPRHIVIAADSFKGSNTSTEVGQAMQRGFQKVFPQTGFRIVPVADGGEGTVEAVLLAVGGHLERLRVRGPLDSKGSDSKDLDLKDSDSKDPGRGVDAFWGRLSNGKAVLEMAAASGLPLLAPGQRNPLRTHTYGTGELIRAALDAGARQIMIGIGGSATNDGGVGMAQALGARFLDKDGGELQGGGGSLAELECIDTSGMDPRLKEAEILIACDVSNPLLGERGASAVYGPQKGANPEMVAVLDANLAHLAAVVTRDLGTSFADEPGAGAAGGLGFGLMSFCGGKLLSGIETVLRIIDFEKILAAADLVLTGEGRLDGQSVYGKVPVGVARWAKKAGKPVVAIVGELGAEAHAVFDHGIDALFPTVDRAMKSETAIAESRSALEATAERVARALVVGLQLGQAGSSGGPQL
ncbi:glycerate kinase [Candidatus Haliotispira prima]|uniref:Glycerate kinase n=1 Tax=Candidatus Haliotispira prima TaxID=3034016 RepID=A0ABY8MGI9_9SPIO|nr:glycerate kinase [Candidatus Haliotispira prima]